MSMEAYWLVLVSLLTRFNMNTFAKIHLRKTFLLLALCFSFQIIALASDEICRIKLTNNLTFDRNSETVVVSSSEVFLPEGKLLSDCRLFDAETGLVVRTQWIDTNADGRFEAFFFSLLYWHYPKKFIF
jgi:hypothetical protein